MGRPFDIPLQLPLTHSLRQDGLDIFWALASFWQLYFLKTVKAMQNLLA